MMFVEAMIYPSAKRIGLHWLLWVALPVLTMELHTTEMDLKETKDSLTE